jgi:hypothetical protein
LLILCHLFRTLFLQSVTYQQMHTIGLQTVQSIKNFYMFRRRDAILRTSQVRKSTSTKVLISIALKGLMCWWPSFNKGMPWQTWHLFTRLYLDVHVYNSLRTPISLCNNNFKLAPFLDKCRQTITKVTGSSNSRSNLQPQGIWGGVLRGWRNWNSNKTLAPRKEKRWRRRLLVCCPLHKQHKLQS